MNINPILKEADKLKMDGSFPEAIKLCQRVIMQDTECSEAYEEIGDNYLSLKDYEKAEKALKYALKLNPQSANANYLMGFLSSCTGDWHRSIEHLELSDCLERNHPEILRCLGWSYFHSGNRKRGLIVLERALALNPNDCLILSDLGVCYLHERNFDRTIELLTRASNIEPENKKVKECLKTAVYFKKEFEGRKALKQY